MAKVSCIVPNARLKELHKELNSKSAASQTAVSVETYKGNWTREAVAKQTDKVFLFGDNTNDRVNTHYVPSSTQAVIRGLPNAIGIDTKKNRGTTEDSYFTDDDFDVFREQVDGAVQQAINSGKTIVIPEGGIGTGKAQLERRAPKLFSYLQTKLQELSSQTATSEESPEVTMDDILMYVREFCAEKGIAQQDWHRFEDEAIEYVRGAVNGETPVVYPVSGVEYARERVRAIVETFKTIVREAADFSKSHKYLVKDEDGNWVEADTTVSSYGKALKEDLNFDIESYEKEDIPMNVGMALGNTYDSFVRDFFSEEGIKEEYPNLDKGRKEMLLNSLNMFKESLDKMFPDGYYVESSPFPIAARFMDSKGNWFTLAGEVDLLVSDTQGNLYIFDMKAINENRDSQKIIDDYTNAMTLYRAILLTQFPELKGKVSLGLLVAQTRYLPGEVSRGGLYQIDEDGQVYFEGTPIQNLSQEDYSITLTTKLTNNRGYIIPLRPNISILTESESLTEEEKQWIMTGLSIDGRSFDDSLMEIEGMMVSDSYTETVTEQDTDKFIAPVTASDIQYLGTTLGKYVGMIVRDLQDNDSMRELIFPEEDAYSLIGLPEEDILTNDRLLKILEYIRVEILADKMLEYPVDSPQFKRYEWANNNFDDIIQAASVELLKNTGRSVRQKSQERGDFSSDENAEAFEVESLEEDTREPYAYEAYKVPVQETMSQKLKNILSTLPEVEYELVETEDGYEWRRGEVKTDETWGLVKFLDRDIVINSLFERLHTAKSSEEMIERLTSEENVAQYPWFPEVAAFIRRHPELRSSFFSTFRKNRTNYTQTTVTTKSKTDPETNETTTEKNVGTFELVRLEMLNRIKKEFAGRISMGESTVFIPVEGSIYGLSDIDFDVVDELRERLTSAKRSQKGGKGKKIRALAEALEALGFGDVTQSLNSIKNTKKGSILDSLYTATEEVLRTIATSNRTRVVPFIDIKKGRYNVFNLITSKLVSILPARYEVSAFDNGDNYQVYVAPNFIGDLIEGLSEGTSEQIQEFIYNKYGRSFQTSMGIDGEVHYVSSWLERINKDPEEGHNLRMFIETSSMGVSYAEMDRTKYPLSVFYEYFAPARDHVHPNDRFARYAVPIASDKPVSRYIEFYKHSFLTDKEGAKDAIASEAAMFVMMEIQRMRKVLWDTKSKKSPSIEYYTPNVPASVLKKLSGIKNRKGKVTFEDILDEEGKLQGWTKVGGFGFRYFPFFNSEFEKRSKFAQMVLDYINFEISDNEYLDILNSAEQVFKEGMEERYQTSFLGYLKNIGLQPAIFLEGNHVEHFKDKMDALEEFFWNQTLAAANILSMTVLDPAFYPNPTQLQKRFSQIHSMTDRPDITATFIDDSGHSRRLSDGIHRYIIIEDEIKKSEAKQISEAAFDRMIELAPNENTRRWLRKQKKAAAKVFDKINVTDGQAFSSPEGFLKKLGMLGLLDNNTRLALLDLCNGRFNYDNMNLAIQPFKPFVFTWENMGTEDNPWYSTVQLKDSEALLFMTGYLAESLISQGMAVENNKLFELFKRLHDSAYTDGVWNGQGIDTVVFHSVVKVGASNIIPNSSDKDFSKTLDKYLSQPGYVHQHPFYNWGKQQNNPPHLQDHTQAMPSQTRIIAVSNISDDSPVQVGTEMITGKELKEQYFRLLAEDMEEGREDLEEALGLNESRPTKVTTMSDFLKTQLQRDARTTVEQLKAVSVRNGEFNVPLGDPVTQERYASSLFSAVKKRINKEEIPGGPVVQATCWGLVPPKVVRGEDGQVRIQCYITFPTAELERKMTNPETGAIMPIPEAISKGIISREQLTGLASRIPVEEKYSVYPIEIIGFLPRVVGELIIFPDENTGINGGDFDTDKAYVQIKSIKRKLSDIERRKNRITALQEAALNTPEGQMALMNPQDTSELREVAELLDPNYKYNDFSMVFPESQFYFQHQNMTGKEMVAISASSNIAHCLGSLTDIRMAAPSLAFNGISFDSLSDEDGFMKLDPVYSPFDGSLVSRSIGMHVGATADNAKDPIAASINYVKSTANLYLTLLRFGVPLKTTILFMSQDFMRKAAASASLSGASLNEILSNELGLLSGETGIPVEDIERASQGMNITDEELLNNIRFPDRVTTMYLIGAALKLIPAAEAVFRVSQILKLNSTNNAVGPTIWRTLKNQRAILEFIDEVQSGRLVGKDTLCMFSPDTYNNIKRDLPFLAVLVEAYTEVVPKMMGEDFIPFTKSFTGLLDYMSSRKLYIGEMSDKELARLFNEFMLYLSTGTTIDGKPLINASLKERTRVFYEVPLAVMASRSKIKNLFTGMLGFEESAAVGVPIPTLTLETANLPSDIRDRMSASWAALVSPDNPELGITSKLSDDLITYNIFRGGFRFTPKGFLNLAPNAAKAAYKGGIYTAISTAKNWDMTLDDLDYFNFLQQRARNHSNSDRTITHWNKEILEAYGKYDDGKIIVREDAKISDKWVAIRYGKGLYVRTSPDSLTFVRVSSLGFNKQGLEYDRMDDGLSMMSVRSKDEHNAVIRKFRELYNDVEIEDQPDVDSEENPVEEPEIPIEDIKTKRRAKGIGNIEWKSLDDLLMDDDFIDWSTQHHYKFGTDTDILYSENTKEVVAALKDMVKNSIGEERFTKLEKKIKRFIELKNICK